MDIQLTPHQQQAFTAVQSFVTENAHDIFILKGYAGTGKTTLVKFLLDWLAELENTKPVLLASTGRAAKVLENKAQYEAFTVHSHIYSFEVLEEKGGSKEDAWNADKTGQIVLNFGLKTSPTSQDKIIYVVDEASMLSHVANNQNSLTKFGTGNLLSDLLDFVGKNKIMFVGDPVQLPPPTGKNPFSPALSIDFMQKTFAKSVTGFELKEIMRQKEGNPILDLATEIRNIVINRQNRDWQEVMNKKAASIYTPFTQAIMIDRYLAAVGKQWKQAVILCHSNKQAFYLNMGMRKKIFKGEPPMHLLVGELLMVAQNSYYVPLANGDQVIVRSVKPAGSRAGFRFLEIEAEAVHNHQIYKTLLLQDFLFRPEANLDPEKQRHLLIDFDRRARNRNLKRNSKDYKDAMLNDPYLNALRAKFGYAVTCHKAQGGEWPHVFINLSETLNLLSVETRFRWLYTAVTRAQEVLHLKPVWKGNKGFDRNRRR